MLGNAAGDAAGAGLLTAAFCCYYFLFLIVSAVLLINLLIAMMSRRLDVETKHTAEIDGRVAFGRVVLRFERLVERTRLATVLTLGEDDASAAAASRARDGGGGSGGNSAGGGGAGGDGGGDSGVDRSLGGIKRMGSQLGSLRGSLRGSARSLLKRQPSARDTDASDASEYAMGALRRQASVRYKSFQVVARDDAALQGIDRTCAGDIFDEADDDEPRDAGADGAAAATLSRAALERALTPLLRASDAAQHARLGDLEAQLTRQIAQLAQQLGAAADAGDASAVAPPVDAPADVGGVGVGGAAVVAERSGVAVRRRGPRRAAASASAARPRALAAMASTAGRRPPRAW